MVVARREFFSQSEQRELDDVVSFYDDKVTQYASQELQTVTLKTLLGLGRSGSSSAETSTPSSTVPPIRDLEINLDVARYARKELPVRLARLLKATQKLPFIVGTNPYIKQVYKLYYDSFQTLTATPQEIRNKEDLDRFAGVLQTLVASHADVIPMLSQGFQECKKYMRKEDIKEYLDGVIRARIGIRLIAEQAISLRDQRDNIIEELQEGKQQQPPQGVSLLPRDVVGVVHTELKPADLIKTCASFVQELCDVNYGSSPEVVINGQTDTTFTYVPVHLEYILCELLKNAVRATVEFSQKIGRSALDPHGRDGTKKQASLAGGGGSGSGSGAGVIVNQDDDQDLTKRPNEFGHPPVEVTIAQGEHEITIRIRDHGGGISREHFDAIFDYSFTTVKNEEDESDAGAGDSPYGVDSIFKGVNRLAMQAGLGGPIAGLGFGLPLTRIYAQYFGGDMQLVSLQGYGCDVFLKLKQIDETLDHLQI
ncbi:26S proteasome regulatory subunit 7 [Dissophora globulifera]|nr:26S proteasome regulatory subunit 7 [Dissophora globulifera]